MKAEKLAMDRRAGLAITDRLREERQHDLRKQRRANAEYLRTQIREREAIRASSRGGEIAGYYGPEERAVSHRADEYRQTLKDQMQVDRMRRHERKQLELAEERQLVRNSITEMDKDNARDDAKVRKQH